MVDQLADEFPALAGLLVGLEARIGDELTGETARRHAVLGGALILLALAEHAKAEDMRHQFPRRPGLMGCTEKRSPVPASESRASLSGDGARLYFGSYRAGSETGVDGQPSSDLDVAIRGRSTSGSRPARIGGWTSATSRSTSR